MSHNYQDIQHAQDIELNEIPAAWKHVNRKYCSNFQSHRKSTVSSELQN